MSTSHADSFSVLLGRDDECRALEQLAAAVVAGQGSALVLRGEAGVGKTALLDHLAGHSPGCRLATVTGVESEMELPFAGVHQLCAPWLDRLEQLPEPQAAALATALGLQDGPAPERFLVGLATLSLLAQVAAEAPLLCIVDDAQWLDRVSVQTLAFVARRLGGERVGLVAAVRAPSSAGVWRGVPELAVAGLDPEPASRLLEWVVPGPADALVRARVLDEAGGNPLALRELARGPAARFEGGFALPGSTPLESRIERTFVQRERALPAATRLLLLTAAAEPVGDVALLQRAGKHLGFTLASAAPAQDVGLVDLGATVRFRHPLIRSAIYRSADLADRQRVHGALAAATDPGTDPDRRAWHRAHAAPGLDEDVALDLERSADRARSRGGIAAAAAFLERAATLTPDPARRTARALAAARAMVDSADLESAQRLLGTVDLGPTDPLQRAMAARLRAQIDFTQRRGGASVRALLTAAELLQPLDHALARETYLEAMAAAIFCGRLSGSPDAREAAARAARAAPRGPQPARPVDLLLDAVATRFTTGYSAALQPLQQALAALQGWSTQTGDDVTGWLWLTCPVAPEPLAPELWDYQSWRSLADRAVALARSSGALGTLPVALSYRAGVHVHAGELDSAATLIAESDALAVAAGNPPLRYASLMLLAWRGEQAAASAGIRAARADATLRGEGRALGLAGYATAVLGNGLGRYEDALAGAQLAVEYDDLGFYGWSLAELVEAAARSGAPEVAREWLPRLAERTTAAGTDWALGVLAASRALLAPDRQAEDDYQEAVTRLEATPVRTQAARARLLYGEWLRRQGRRRDAREHLQRAWSQLEEIGAHAFAARAAHELRATGAHPRRHAVGQAEPLTAQEEQIARLAAHGLTNPQIGAQLFLSPHTVEWHLRKVFVKCGVTSRTQLADRFPRVDGTVTADGTATTDGTVPAKTGSTVPARASGT